MIKENLQEKLIALIQETVMGEEKLVEDLHFFQDNISQKNNNVKKKILLETMQHD